MNSARLRELQVRRAHLVELAARQRLDIARTFQEWEGSIALVDRGIAVWNLFRSRPALLVAGALLVAILRRRRAMTWMSGAVALWRLYRSARILFAGR